MDPAASFFDLGRGQSSVLLSTYPTPAPTAPPITAPQVTQPPVTRVPAAPTPAPIAPPDRVFCCVPLRSLQPDTESPKRRTAGNAKCFKFWILSMAKLSCLRGLSMEGPRIFKPNRFRGRGLPNSRGARQQKSPDTSQYDPPGLFLRFGVFANPETNSDKGISYSDSALM